MPPRRQAASKVKYAESEESDAEHVSSAGEGSGSDFEDDEQEGSPSDAEDEDDDGEVTEEEEQDVTPRKRKTQAAQSSATPTPTKKRKIGKGEDAEDKDFEEAGAGEVYSVTKLAPAPKEHHQKGILGKPVIDFMRHLANPKYNDREWFHANERVWKWVKQDFEDFTADYLESLMEDVDETVPYLPVKDMVYRIHRDVRFSNDKTPYKRTLMSTFSRGGRKGPFAGYHLTIRAGGESALHAGLWDPPTEHLAALRSNILNKTQGVETLKEIIARKDFIKCFGPPKPNPAKGIIGSLWHHDPLKKAPKGVDKDHPDIHLLRLKSYCITRRFTDEETHQPDFKQKLIETAKIARDFVHCVNDMVHPEPEG